LAQYVVASCTSGDAAESFHAEIAPTRAAPLPIVPYGVVYVAAQDVTAAKAVVGGDEWVGASGANGEVAAVDEVTIRKAEIRFERVGVQVRTIVPALETEQSCVIQWAVAHMEECRSGSLIEN
jgi:hypothetical protein